MKSFGFVRSVLAVLTVALALTVCMPLRAEFAAEPQSTDVGVLILGIIEGPDPIPQVIWEPIRNVDPALILNGDGAVRGDGRPDVGLDPATRVPHVVWAYNNGSDFDIAYSVWEEDAWSETEYLTFDTLNQIDPRIHVTADAVYVVWWEQSSSSVWFTKHPQSGNWSAPEQVVASLPSSSPSILFWEDELLIAAEIVDGADREIRVSTRMGVDSYISQTVASVGESLELDVVLHGEQGKLWIDWCASPTLCAYSVRESGAWSAPVQLPSVGPSWVDMENTRMLIRTLVLSAP